MTFIDRLLQDEAFRLAEFPVAEKSIFMAHAGVTILPRRATKAMQDYLEGACMAMQEFPAAWRAMTETRALSAKLIGAKAVEIALLGRSSLHTLSPPDNENVNKIRVALRSPATILARLVSGISSVQVDLSLWMYSKFSSRT